MKNITKNETKKIWSIPSLRIIHVNSTKGGVMIDFPEDDSNIGTESV